MAKQIAKCEWCLTESINDELKCRTCGGPIAVLEPWVIKCGWCTSSNRRDLTANCTNCGGELPHIPGTPRLPEPPKTPRQLPRGYESKIRYWKNVHFIVGCGFMLFLPTIIFPIIGFFILRYAIRKGNNKINSLKHGISTLGVIDEVYMDRSQHINGNHPYRIDYTFQTPKEEWHGHAISWDESNLKRPKGEHLWVVYNADDLDQNNMWPPLS